MAETQSKVFGGDPETRFDIGGVEDGFMFKRAMRLPGGLGNVYEFEHVKSGAHWLHCETEETRYQFAVAFRTPVLDDRGIPHILEHMVFAGSEKYRAADACKQVRNRTCIFGQNGSTLWGYTNYYFSSALKDEYFKVMDYHLDSVFHPLLTEEVFRREIWRFTGCEGQKGKLAITGVVYNEMKSSWLNRWFDMWMFGKLLPGCSRSYCSGGRPSQILEVSLKDVKAYHEKWYKASNAYIMTQGSIPLAELRQYFGGILKTHERQVVEFPQYVPYAGGEAIVSETLEVPWNRYAAVDICELSDDDNHDRARLMRRQNRFGGMSRRMSKTAACRAQSGRNARKEAVAWYLPCPFDGREVKMLEFAIREILDMDRERNAVRYRCDIGPLSRRRRLLSCRRFAYKVLHCESGSVFRWEWGPDAKIILHSTTLSVEVKRLIEWAVNDSEFAQRLVKAASKCLEEPAPDGIETDVCEYKVLEPWIFNDFPFGALQKGRDRLLCLEIQACPDACIELLRKWFLDNPRGIDLVVVPKDGEDRELEDAERAKIQKLDESARTKALAKDRRICSLRHRGDGSLPITAIEKVAVQDWMPEFEIQEDRLSRAKVVRVGKGVRGAEFCGVFVDCGDLPIEQYAWLDLWTRQSRSLSRIVGLSRERQKADGNEQTSMCRPKFERCRRNNLLFKSKCDGLLLIFSMDEERTPALISWIFEMLAMRDPLNFCELVKYANSQDHLAGGEILGDYLLSRFVELGENGDVEALIGELVRDASSTADRLHNPARWSFFLQASDRTYAEWREVILNRCRAACSEHFSAGMTCGIHSREKSRFANMVPVVKARECDQGERPRFKISIPIDEGLLGANEQIVRLGAHFLSANFAWVKFREHNGGYGVGCTFNEAERKLVFHSQGAFNIGQAVNAVVNDLQAFVREFDWAQKEQVDTIFSNTVRRLAAEQIQYGMLAYQSPFDLKSRFVSNVLRIIQGATAEGVREKMIELSKTTPELMGGVLLEVLRRGMRSITVEAWAPRQMLEEANEVLPKGFQFQFFDADQFDPYLDFELGIQEEVHNGR